MFASVFILFLKICSIKLRLSYVTSAERRNSMIVCPLNILLEISSLYADPPRPPVVWVHPCNCTLVAHEKCLLNWIQSSQEEPSRKKKALKCPQCSATYELESENPRLLKILNNLNGSITLAGKVVFACGIVGSLVACGFGVFPHPSCSLSH
jgi:uncharacterized protein YbaR (Trm112 family)